MAGEIKSTLVLCLVVEHSYLFVSLIHRIIQVFSLAYVVLYMSYVFLPCYSVPQSLEWEGLPWAAAATAPTKAAGIGPSISCAELSLCSTWGLRGCSHLPFAYLRPLWSHGLQATKEEGSKKHLSLFSLLFALKVLPRSAEGHSLKGTEKLNAWFSPMEVLRCWILWKIHSFKCCDGRRRANEFFTWVGIQWEGSGDAEEKSEGSWRARALGTEVCKPRSWKGFPEVLTSRPFLQKIIQNRSC